HIPHWLGQVAHPGIVVVGVGLALLLARRVRANPWERALPLLALVLLLRCLLDPVDNGYYHEPFFIALVAADALTGSLVPTLVATAVLGFLTATTPPPGTLNAIYLVWAIPFAAYLAARA